MSTSMRTLSALTTAVAAGATLTRRQPFDRKQLTIVKPSRLVARLGRRTLFTLHKALLLRPPTRSPSTAAARADPEDIALDGPGQ